MKVYESVYTYLPFIYLFFISVIFAEYYHSVKQIYRPYVLVTTGLVNSVIYHNHPNHSLIHYHLWKIVTCSMFGILINTIINKELSDFHMDSETWNVVLSLLYMFIINMSIYYYRSDQFAYITHILFCFVPFQRIWQINLYTYVFLAGVSTVIMFFRCTRGTLTNPSTHKRPLLKYFMYLRIDDYTLIFGVLQLLLDVYETYIPDIEAVKELEKTLGEIKRGMKKNEDEERVQIMERG